MQEFLEKNQKPLKYLGLVFLLFFLYLVFMNVDDFTSSQDQEKKLEVENITFSGYKGGVLSWILRARYVWSNYTLDNSVVENIYDGKLFDNGKVILKNFSARKVNTNAPQERLYADDGVRAALIRTVDGVEHDVDIWAEQMQYLSDLKKSFVREKVRIKDEGTLVEASSAEINHQDNTVKFGKDFVLTRDGSKITGDELLVRINEQQFQVNGNVDLLRLPEAGSSDEFKKQQTSVLANTLLLKVVSDNTTAEVEGNVRIKQSDKQGFADKAIFTEQTDNLLLQKNAGLIFDKTDWLLDQKTIDKLKNAEAKQTVYEKLTMRADNLSLSTKTKDVQATGHVVVAVKNKQATSTTAFYDNAKELITLTGTVYLKKDDGSVVQADKVLVEIKTEKFIADGQAESTIILKR